ncbi:hypothetical protein QVD17_35080 [Tagetes erecta]|uniref:Uncharacterized protein n=1 Tax=Tagetes erecta TaxID=13708 RepID=A0AAD8K086_TARER|nr:hypothetical protein QVD17_35080 [Tagetes erecta]
MIYSCSLQSCNYQRKTILRNNTFVTEPYVDRALPNPKSIHGSMAASLRLRLQLASTQKLTRPCACDAKSRFLIVIVNAMSETL